MNKEEFIGQLKQSINILDDQEQQYFVEEYTQHIEMKMSQGMTEEEAVKAMGSVEELSKEILESYHVKTDLGEKKPEKHADYGKFFGKIKAQADKIYAKIAAGCRKMVAGIKGLFRRQKPQVEENAAQNDIMEISSPKNRTKQREQKSEFQPIIWIKRFFGFCGKVIRKCLYIVLWCLLLMWNCALIFCGLFGIFVLACGVFAIGVLVVMLVQGYPLIGATIATVGATISVGALTVACFVLTKWKIGRKNNVEGGEAHA